MDDRTDGGLAVGVVGDEPADVASAATRAGAAVQEGPLDEVLASGVDAVVPTDEPALLAVARAGPSVPVVPVDAGRGVRSVPRDAVADAIDRLHDSEWHLETHPVVDVRLGDERAGRALMDVTVVTAEPAHISEYAVRTGDELVQRIRADGVVVATPAGSPSYARAAGGPVVPPEAGVGVVAPIAPFVTDPDHWALPLSSISLAVERDTAEVTVYVDDSSVGTVDPGQRVSLHPAHYLEVVRLPEGRSPFRCD